MKPVLRVRLVNTAAILNCIMAGTVLIYGGNWLNDYMAKQAQIKKLEEEYKRNQQQIGRVIPNHPPGSLTAPPPSNQWIVSNNSGSITSSGGFTMLSSGNDNDLHDGVELKTEGEKRVFNQWFYYTGTGKEYFSYLKKDEIPDAEGNYGKHLQVSVREYVWMMQWKFQNGEK